MGAGKLEEFVIWEGLEGRVAFFFSPLFPGKDFFSRKDLKQFENVFVNYISCTAMLKLP